mmetsp:Transcript_5696/g.12398  ORF Transcript_5696/g.12398 Transcript_5696/m.12398 type:complete len:413 (-) Transcript_5696:49-1287(-)
MASSSAPGAPLGCDRRLSRAARSILVRHVLPILRHHSPSPAAAASSSQLSSRNRKRSLSWSKTDANTPEKPEDPTELWEILRDHLSLSNGTSAAAASCPLDPRYDVLLYHETNSHAIPNPAHVGRPARHRSRYNGPAVLHTCEICGKSFHTRYYLDGHMDRAHYTSWDGTQVQDPVVLVDVNAEEKEATADASTSSTNDIEKERPKQWICPATALCPSLGGMEECDRVALETEPYYGRGSAGLGSDGPAIRSQWQRKLLEETASCSEEQMATSRVRCRELFASCFGFGTEQRDLLDELQTHFCDRLTCQHRLQGLAGSLSHTFHSLREEWDHHHSHHGLGVWGCIVVLVLAVFYGGMAFGLWGRKSSRKGGAGRFSWSNRNGGGRGGSSILRGRPMQRGAIGRMYGGKKKAM